VGGFIEVGDRSARSSEGLLLLDTRMKSCLDVVSGFGGIYEMTTHSKKRIAWALMSGGVGAVLLFVVLVTFEPWPRARDWWVYLWPGSGLMLGVAGWVWSRRLYRAEPPQPPAAWIVTLTDLIIATVFAGFCSAIFTGLGERFEWLVPAVGLTGFVFYVHSALAASLSAVFSAWRVPFVIANIGLTLGTMGWMTMGLLTVLITCFGDSRQLADFWIDVLIELDKRDWFRVIQFCVFALPIGAVLMAVVKWRIGKSSGDILLRP